MKTKIQSAIRRSLSHGSKGVTIFETIIAMSIAAIISAATIPKYVGYLAKERVTNAANDIVSDIMNSRMSAIQQNRAFKITFTSTHQYTISRDNNNNGVFETNEILETKDISSSAQSMTLSSTANPVLSSRGTASQATITITGGRWHKNISLSMAGHTSIAE
jgi:Tfp pilus assembly protein FimT